MNLQDYIKQTLTDIVRGTVLANEELKDDVVIGYHTDGTYSGCPTVTYRLGSRQAPVTIVDFKVKVEVDEQLNADGSIKAGVLNVAGGKVTGSVSQSNATGNEVAFSIPLVWKQKGK